jgi:undecaprenyl-diphosphatase
VPFLHILVLALVQGITEFLPISSSAHLVLLPVVTGWPDQGLIIDVAAHFGSLAAVIVYFWRDIVRLVGGFFRLVGGRVTPEGRMAIFMIVATIPAVLMGLAIKQAWPDGIRSPVVIGINAVVFGVLLYLADRFGPARRGMMDLGLGGALLVGCAQAFALVPGTSRSGITMTAARFLGLHRTEAARFSFLLSVPAVAGASLLEGYDLYRSGDMALATDAAWSAGLTFISSILAIAWLMRWLRSSTFLPFVVYRVILGVGLLAWLFLAGTP